MAKCKYCEKKGFFTTVDSSGLCSKCGPVVAVEVNQRKRILIDSVQLVNDSKNFATRLSRCDLILEHAGHLLQYEDKGIPTLEPRPSEFIEEYTRERDMIIIEEAEHLARKAVAKADVAATSKTKHSALSAGLLKVSEVLEYSENKSVGSEIVEDLKTKMHRAILDGYLDGARKAEFKNNSKKAIDQYQEALYYIKNDDIPDELQKSEIQEIESKIAGLQGNS
jgi:hypothetical protein